MGTDALQNRQAIPDDALVYYAGLLTQQPRSAANLRQILTDYLDVPVEIEQFAGGWYPSMPTPSVVLSGENHSARPLGFGAVVGDEVWDQQSRVRIILGPLDLERYADFPARRKSWDPLRAWIRFFSNRRIRFRSEADPRT